MAPTEEIIEVSVGNIEPKKYNNTPSSPLPSNVSFAKADNLIDFNPAQKKHPLSPVKVTRVDPRFYEEGGPRSRSGKKLYTEYQNLKPPKNAYENIAAFAVPEFNA
jgi:hypothetical protein